ncbi:MAG: hypothetical protein JXK05_13855 [Campylobacterales bacterium]|nr:hypothetical protein [Campylobacterales bacterium]
MKPASIEDFFGSTYRTWQNWKKENRPVADFFSKYPELIEEFLKFGRIQALEHYVYIADPIFEDYVIQNLITVKKINRDLFNLWRPNREFLTRNLKKLQILEKDFSPSDAKIELINFLQDAELGILDSKTKQEEAIDFVRKNLSDIEAYVLLKYPDRFF